MKTEIFYISRFIGCTLRQGNYLFFLPMKCRYFLYEFQEILMEYKIVIYEFEIEFEKIKKLQYRRKSKL